MTPNSKIASKVGEDGMGAIYRATDTKLNREVVITEEQALPVIHQLIDALEYADDKGIVHRNLKPANLKLTADGPASGTIPTAIMASTTHLVLSLRRIFSVKLILFPDHLPLVAALTSTNGVNSQRVVPSFASRLMSTVYWSKAEAAR